MSDQTRGPEKRDPDKHGAHGPADRELRDRLSAVEPPAHAPDFWNALDARIDLVSALRAVETPEHLDGFWASVDAALFAEPDRLGETAEVASLRSTVFDEDAPVAKRVRRRRNRQPWSRRRLETLVQVSAAAAVVALLAGALAWWGTRDQDEPTVAISATTRPTTTTAGGPPTTAPVLPLFSDRSRVENVQPAAPRGSVPVGASPDGKFLYVAGPAQSNERCAFSSPNSPLSTSAMWLYAQTVDGSESHRILTDRVFADPKMTQGPNDKVVVSDSCNGLTSHVIATANDNGALSVDRVISSAAAAPLAVDGAAWSANGTGLFLRGEGAAGWFRYDLANAALNRAPEIAPGALVVEQLANEQIVSVGRRGTTTWTVSVGDREVVALTAPSHGDFDRAVRVDTHHGQLAIAGKDTLLVLSARLPGGPVEVGTFEYAAEAVTWAADDNGLVAAPRGGGLDYLSFVPSVDNQLSTVSLGFTGVAFSMLSVPSSSSLVVRQAVTEGGIPVAGEAFILKLTS